MRQFGGPLLLPTADQTVGETDQTLLPLSTADLTSPRGLPTGYITALEHRLTETEAALFVHASSRRVPPGDVEQVAHRVGTLNDTTARNARIESWKQLPLTSEADIERWRLDIGQRIWSQGDDALILGAGLPEAQTDRDDTHAQPDPWSNDTASTRTPLHASVNGLIPKPANGLSKIAPSQRHKYF